MVVLILHHRPYMPLLCLFTWWYSHTASPSVYAFNIRVCTVMLSYNFNVCICPNCTCLHCDTLTTLLSVYALIKPVCMVILSYSTVRICPHYTCLHSHTLIQNCPYMPSLYLFAWSYSHKTSLSVCAFNIPVYMMILSYNFTARICLYYTCLHGDTLIQFHCPHYTCLHCDTLIQRHCPYMPLFYLHAWWYSHTISLSAHSAIYLFAWGCSYTTSLSVYIFIILFALRDSQTNSLYEYAIIISVSMTILLNNFTVRICLYYTCLHDDTLIQTYCPYIPLLYLFDVVICSYRLTARICPHYTCLHGDTLI